MKLKKIASLALAGVMAVSMLAGCKAADNSTGDQGNTTVETTATGIAKTLNAGQTPGNDAKITFSSDSTMDSMLAAAVKRAGEEATDQQVLDAYVALTGDMGNVFVAGGLVLNGFVLYDEPNPDYEDDILPAEAACKDGETHTFVTVFKSDATDLTKEAAEKRFVNEIDEAASKLTATTKVKGQTAAGHTYYDFTYTGKASMVSVTTVDGTVDYYMLVSVTQTCNAKVA